MCPVLVHAMPIDVGRNDLLSIYRAFGDDDAVRAANKALSPELNPLAAGRLFVTNAIGNRDITTVRDGVPTLDRLPGRILRLAKFLFLARMPTDCRRIENNFRAVEGGESGRF